jgi:predicted  nucleic acid-binding Zn-ribbon protein
MERSNSLTPAEIRLAQYGERTNTWSTATYGSGTEKALCEIALELRETIQQLRTTLAEVRSDAGAKIREAAEHVHAARAERDQLRSELAKALPPRD